MWLKSQKSSKQHTKITYQHFLLPMGRKENTMNLDKHIDNALSLHQKAYSKLNTWEKEQKEAFERHKNTAPRLTTDAAKEEYQKLVKSTREALTAIVEELNEAISIVEAEFLHDLKEYYTPKGEAIVSNDQALLASGILNIDEVNDMVERYANNPTMLRIIGKHAAESNLQLSSIAIATIRKATWNGDAEKRIFDAYKQLLDAPIRMAEQGYAGTTAFMNSTLSADDYAAEAKEKLHRAKL